MNRPSANIVPICFSYFLVIILLFQTVRPVQSIALSSLCGQFGHSCFGGNWGKRELPATSDLIQSNANTNDGGTAVSTDDEETLLKNLLREEIRSSLLRERLRHVLKLE